MLFNVSFKTTFSTVLGPVNEFSKEINKIFSKISSIRFNAAPFKSERSWRAARSIYSGRNNLNKTKCTLISLCWNSCYECVETNKRKWECRIPNTMFEHLHVREKCCFFPHSATFNNRLIFNMYIDRIKFVDFHRVFCFAGFDYIYDKC